MHYTVCFYLNNYLPYIVIIFLNLFFVIINFIFILLAIIFPIFTHLNFRLLSNRQATTVPLRLHGRLPNGLRNSVLGGVDCVHFQ